jgi:hypothetical protein
MKKISVLWLLILNISCTSLMNPQEQPVHLMDVKNNIYTTTCSGMAETIGSCHQKAQKTCAKGYNLIEEKVDSTGVHRAIKFQCKN